MNLSDMIPLRKSVRSYENRRVDEATLAKIAAFIEGTRPLDAKIRVHWEFVGREQVRCICPWTTEQSIAIYTEDVPGALENVGFIFQQVDLYIASLGLGACWLGMGRIRGEGRKDGLRFAMLLAFGSPKGEARRRSIAEFRRKALAEISDNEDIRLEPARLAPSSVNSQPWRFTHDGETIHVHCARGMRALALSDMNRIDMGICLAHLYVSHPGSFEFFRAEGVSSPRGCSYTGSLHL